MADHAGWAILVTVARGGNLIDRRRVELVEGGLPTLPHHHDCHALPVDQAVALVERVTRSAEACAEGCLEALATEVPAAIERIAIRACPPLPATIAERISNYRAQNVADTVMYRGALARAASARGWSVHRFQTRSVLAEAAGALGRPIEGLLAETGARLGPPWRKDHQIAMAAAIAILPDVPSTDGKHR